MTPSKSKEVYLIKCDASILSAHSTLVAAREAQEELNKLYPSWPVLVVAIPLDKKESWK